MPAADRPLSSYAAPWLGAAGVAVLILIGGALPGWTPVSADPSQRRGPDHSLLTDGSWPYFVALGLVLGGCVVAAATYGRGSLAPLALTVTAVPSFALVTELADPPEYYRPYSASLNGIYGDVETGVGGWLTFLTMLGLAAGSTIWLGRGLQILADRRWATGLLVVIVLAAIVGIAVANGYTDDAECNLGRVDESDVSSDWLLWLVLYLPATMVGMGIGAMTRRWFASGWLLLAGAAAACLGLGVIAFQVISLCAD